MIHPVCFGSPALINLDCQVCQGCEFKSACVSSALTRLDAMPDTVEVRTARLRLQRPESVWTSRRGIARRKLTTSEEQGLARLSSRARGIARRLAETGWFDRARSVMHRGDIPEGAGNARLLDAYRALLSGVSERSQLVVAFQQSGLSPASAQVEASTVLSVLEFGRLLTLAKGRIQLSAN